MPHKTLVIGPAWIGDMVMAQVLFKLIKQYYPSTEITVLAPPGTQPLLSRMPEVSHSMVSPFQRGSLQLTERLDFGKALRTESYQQAIVLPNSWKSALIPWAARIPKRTGFLGEYRLGLLNDLRFLDENKYPTLIQQFACLSRPKHILQPTELPYPDLKVSPLDRERTLQRLSLQQYPDRPCLILCPGAEFGPAKRWPASYFAEVARVKIQHGFQVWILGAAKDREIGAHVYNLLSSEKPFCTDLTGKTSLDEAVDLLSLAHLVITNDTGLMHIAAALDRSLIAIYGASSPGFTPPLTAKAQIIKSHLPCAPCFKRSCPLQHHRCMIGLSPQQILEATHVSV